MKLFFLFFLFFLISCDDDLDISEYEKIEINTYFLLDKNKIYLGQHTGTSACGEAANSFAKLKKLKGDEWSYICCTIRKDSDCYEKIR